MLSERTIINGLLFLGGMVLGPYMIILTLEANQFAILSFAGLVFLFCIFFFVRDRISVFPVIGGYFGGTLNFLPLGFTLVEVFSLTAIFYYLINYVALKRRPINLGSPYLLFPILIIGAIILYHSRTLGLKILGGGSEGSRPGLLILVSIVTYLCGINIPSPSATFLSRLPLYCFALAMLGSVPFLLTTYIPSLAPYVYYISGNVNLDAYIQSVSGADDSDVARNGALAGVGSSLASILVCYFPITTWWRPQRWIFIVLTAFSFYLVLLSGYRNLVFGFLLFIIFATLCYTGWRILFLLPLLTLMPLGIMVVQNDHPLGIVLPGTVQRSMSFLPANWDDSIVESAESSNDFRNHIKRVYMSEYFTKSPWIGNGFIFDPGEPEKLGVMATTPGVSDPEYYTTKAFVVSKNFHTGWISLYDAVGIIGGIAYIILNVSVIGIAANFIFKKNTATNSKLFPLEVWLFCNLSSSFIGYFTTFGNFSQGFIGLCGSAIILFHLARIQRQDAFIISPSSQMTLVPPGQTKAFSPLGAS